MKTYCFLLFALALFIRCCYCDSNSNHEAVSRTVQRPSVISTNAPKVQNFLFKIIKIFAQAIKSLPVNARNRKTSASAKADCTVPLVNDSQVRINDLDKSNEPLSSQEYSNIHMRFGANGHDSDSSNKDHLRKNLSQHSYKDHPVDVDSYEILKDDYLRYDHLRDPIKKVHIHNDHPRDYSKGRHGNKDYSYDSSKKYHLHSDHPNDFKDDHLYNAYPDYSSKDQQKPSHLSLKVHREHSVPTHSIKSHPLHSDFSHVFKDHRSHDSPKGHRFNNHHRHYSPKENYFHIRPLHTSLDDEPVRTDLAKPIKIVPVHIDLSHDIPKNDRLHEKPYAKQTIKIHPVPSNSHISKDYHLNHDHSYNIPKGNNLYKGHSHDIWEKHHHQKPHLHDSPLEDSNDRYAEKHYSHDVSKDLYKDIDQFHDHPGNNLRKISTHQAIKNHPIDSNLDLSTNNNIHNDNAHVSAKSNYSPKDHSDDSVIGTRLRNGHSQDQHLYKYTDDPVKERYSYNDHSREYTVIFRLPKDHSHDSSRAHYVPEAHVHTPSKDHHFGIDNLKGHLSHLEPIRTSFKDHPVVVDFDSIKLNPIHVNLPGLSYGSSNEHHGYAKGHLSRLEPIRTSFKDHPVVVDFSNPIKVNPINVNLRDLSPDTENEQILNVDHSRGRFKCNRLNKGHIHDSAISARLHYADSEDLSRGQSPKDYIHDSLNDDDLVTGNSNGHHSELELEPVHTSFKDHPVVLSLPDSIKINPIHINVDQLHDLSGIDQLPKEHTHDPSKDHDLYEDHPYDSAINVRLHTDSSQDSTKAHLSKVHVHHPSNHYDFRTNNIKEHLSHLEPVRTSFKEHPVVVDFTDSINVKPIHIHLSELSYGSSKEDLHVISNGHHFSHKHSNDDLSYVDTVDTSIKDHPVIDDSIKVDDDSTKVDSIHLVPQEVPQDASKNDHLPIDQSHNLNNNYTQDSYKKLNLDEDSSTAHDSAAVADYSRDSSTDQNLTEDDTPNLTASSKDYEDIPSQDSTINVTIRVLNDYSHSHDSSKDHPVHNDHSEHSTIDIRLLNDNSRDLSNDHQLHKGHTQKSSTGRHSHKPCTRHSAKHHVSNDQSQDSIVGTRLHNGHPRDNKHSSKGYTHKPSADHSHDPSKNQYIHKHLTHDPSKEHRTSNDNSRDFTVIVRLPKDHSDDSSKSRSLYKGHTQDSSKDHHLGIDSSIGHLSHLEPVHTSFKDHPVVLDLADSIKVPIHLDHLNQKHSIGHLSPLEPVQTSFKDHPVVLDLTDPIKVDPVHVDLPGPSEDHHLHTEQSHDISKSDHSNHKHSRVPSNGHQLHNTPSYNSPKDYHSHVGYSQPSNNRQLQYSHNPSKGRYSHRKPSRGSSKGHRLHPKYSHDPSKSHYLHRKYPHNPSKSRRLHHEPSYGYSKGHQPHIDHLNELSKSQHVPVVKSTVHNLPKDLHIDQKVHRPHAVKNYPVH